MHFQRQGSTRRINYFHINPAFVEKGNRLYKSIPFFRYRPQNRRKMPVKFAGSNYLGDIFKEIDMKTCTKHPIELRASTSEI